jgi:hypothetical protein
MAKIHDLLSATRINADGNVTFVRRNADESTTEFEVSDTLLVSLPGSGVLWNALAASPKTMLSDADAVLLDLSTYTEVRFVSMVDVAGSAGSLMRLYYTTDFGTWTALTSNTVNLASATTQVTAWESIPAAAQTLVAVQFGAIGGNGVTDTRSFVHSVYFRR